MIIETVKQRIHPMAFILIAAMFTSSVLLYYSFLLQTFLPPSNLIREYAVCFGQLAFQAILLLIANKKHALIIDYLTQMIIVSLLGALLLLPIMILAYFMDMNPVVYLAYFFAIVLFMFFDHKKRVTAIQAPVWLTYTWVLYRCIVLLFIL